MKRLYILFLFVVFFFTLFLSFSNHAYAFVAHPIDLQTSVSCSGSNNNNSTVTFSWKVTGIANYNTYFWKTGDSSETQVPGDSVTQNVSNNTTYNWYVKVKDSGVCLLFYSCESTADGSPITSLTCPPPAGTCTSFTYSTWGNCSATGTQTRTIISSSPTGCTGGNPILTQSCTNPTNIYNCANKDPRCSDPAIYSSCKDFAYGTNVDCLPPNCAMDNTSGDKSKWTISCAYSKIQPTPGYCRPEGDKNCSGNTGSQGNCCANLICNAPGADKTALGNGTCVKAPASLGETCNTCLPGSKWDSVKNSCVDSGGNNTNIVSAVYCNTLNQTCTQGEGCIETVSQDIGSPMPPPCSIKDANGTCLFMNTDIGSIAIDPTLFIKSIFGIILSFSGGIAMLLIIASGYRMLISQGNPEALKEAREQLIAAIVGLLFIIFALVILQIIGYDILKIPGFSPS